METSTPVHSPSKKKHSLAPKFIAVDETLGDVESEIQLRRQEAINKSTEARRRLSAAPLLAGYTASQLSQHCKDVIKLSTENKINCKNAFNFWLIDVMAAMAKKNDSEINKNFQVASCTLDASVKIYGYRVDAIHTDAVKIAGGFYSKEANSNEDNEKEGECEKGEDVAFVGKKKKKRKKLTVVKPEMLNAKPETEILFDVQPRQNFLSLKSEGSDILMKIPKYNDGGLMVLDSDYPCWPYGENNDSVPKFDKNDIFNHESLFSLLSDIKVSKDECLCSYYKDFEFGKTNQENDSDDEFQVSQNSGKFEFDINASVHDFSLENTSPNQRNKINIPIGGFDSDQEIEVLTENQKNHNIPISEMKCRISMNPSDYSVFDEKVFKAWAGPSHWKVKPVRKPLEEFTYNDDSSKPIPSKRTRKGRIKFHAGLFDVPKDILEKNLLECEKTTLFKSTMLNWNVQNTTMPKDLKYQSKNLFSLYHIPSFSVTYKPDEKEEEETELSDQCNDENNRIDESEYCSLTALQQDNEFLHTEEEEANLQEGDEAWNLNNMVEAPNKVQKIQMSTFKRRKHIDIKHLKRGLWSVLTNNSESDAGKKETVDKTYEFKDLVKLYSSKIPKTLGCSPSSPLIFNALLHLTNEKCLTLTQNSANKTNFLISQ